MVTLLYYTYNLSSAFFIPQILSFSCLYLVLFCLLSLGALALMYMILPAYSRGCYLFAWDWRGLLYVLDASLYSEFSVLFSGPVKDYIVVVKKSMIDAKLEEILKRYLVQNDKRRIRSSTMPAFFNPTYRYL